MLQSTSNVASKPVCKTPTYEELTKDPLPMIEEPFVVYTELHEKYQAKWLMAGGLQKHVRLWIPSLLSSHMLVIRAYYLQGFLQRMHPLLRKQLLRYQIFVIDQSGEKKFNQAEIVKCGTVEAASVVPLKKAVGKGYRFCFVMHDVDMLSLSDGLPYNCQRKMKVGRGI